MLKKNCLYGYTFFCCTNIKIFIPKWVSQYISVYTQPPQKSQRGQKINKSPIQGISETLNIECRTPEFIKR